MIAVNPLNRRNLIDGANDYRIGYGQSGFYASFDGGRSWYDGIIPIPSWPDGDVPDGGGDPVVVFDRNGTAYYVGLAFERANGRSALVVSRSTNNGRTWSRPSFTTGDGVVVANLDPDDTSVFRDKEWAVVDMTSGRAQPFQSTNDVDALRHDRFAHLRSALRRWRCTGRRRMRLTALRSCSDFTTPL
jgi:hypothetical protein